MSQEVSIAHEARAICESRTWTAVSLNFKAPQHVNVELLGDSSKQTNFALIEQTVFSFTDKCTVFFVFS